MSEEISFPAEYEFLFVDIFGDTTRVKLVEFFIYTSSKTDNLVWTYISQLSRILNISKSSIKNNVDELIDYGILKERTIETHAKNPKRNLCINKDNPAVRSLIEFYNRLAN